MPRFPYQWHDDGGRRSAPDAARREAGDDVAIGETDRAISGPRR
ncbi:hypothetical protein [Nonomuraea sp. NPDC049646]